MLRTPPSNVRMIALDLDGTLLCSDKTIGPGTRAALHAAHARGIEVVLASGRMTPAMEQTAERLGLDCYIVSYNGGAVCSKKAAGRRRLLHQPLPSDVARELYAYGRQRRFQVNFYHEDVILSENAPHLQPWIEIYRSRTDSPFRFVEALEAYLHHPPTKLLYVLDPALRKSVEEELTPHFGKRATIVRTDPEYLEFLNPQTDKGKAVVKLAEILGIPSHEIMAVGDGDNDVTMLKLSGWGVAMANAGRGCREAADALIEFDCNNDGVGHAVERWALKERT